MSTRTSILSLAVVAMVVAASSTGWAQEAERPVGPGDLKLTGVSQKLVLAPNVADTSDSLGTATQMAQKRWLKVEAAFTSAREWTDDVQLKFYVLMGKQPKMRMFVGDVTHINVARGQAHYSGMFVHPSTVIRYGNGQAEAVAVVLSYQNRPLDALSDPPSNRRWWEQFTPEPGYVLSPDETPWSVVAFKRYEAIKSR